MSVLYPGYDPLLKSATAAFRTACRLLANDRSGRVGRVDVVCNCGSHSGSALHIVRTAHLLASEYGLRSWADVQHDTVAVAFARKEWRA
ncbi:MAG: hypothetical protein QJR03_11620 [Sphaerobacter sp.]|nr:hypothetical protein [Sphaerobacter sp.]